MTYPLYGGPKVGDVVTLKGVVTKVERGLIDVNVSTNIHEGTCDPVRCCAKNARAAERKVVVPKVGDVITWGGKVDIYEVAAIRGDTMILWRDSFGNHRSESLRTLQAMNLEVVR